MNEFFTYAVKICIEKELTTFAYDKSICEPLWDIKQINTIKKMGLVK